MHAACTLWTVFKLLKWRLEQKEESNPSGMNLIINLLSHLKVGRVCSATIWLSMLLHCNLYFQQVKMAKNTKLWKSQVHLRKLPWGRLNLPIMDFKSVQRCEFHFRWINCSSSSCWSYSMICNCLYAFVATLASAWIFSMQSTFSRASFWIADNIFSLLLSLSSIVAIVTWLGISKPNTCSWP